MHRHPQSRPARAALLVAVALLLGFPSVTAAHAELARSVPADGETVAGAPDVIRAVFTEDLADGSEMTLLDASGATIAEGGIDPAHPERLRIEPPALEPGDYEVQWKAFADDGHLETGTFRFTVSAVMTPPPSVSPTPSPVVTEQPSASAAISTPAPATPSPTAIEGPPSSAASSSDVLLPIVTAVVLVATLGGYLMLRRRPSGS